MRIGWRTDKPPEEEENYLVQYDSGNMGVAHWTNITYFGGSPITTKWHWNGLPQYTKVEAWMCLPEPLIKE